MTRAAVLTALYDGYDTLKPICPQDGADVEWVCVTDTVPEDGLGWTIVHVPRPGMHPNRAAKYPKLFPWLYTHADRSVWIDASFRIVSPTFVTEALSFADPVAQFVHPWRDCVYDEAEESSRLPKYAGENFGDQVLDYVERGHPENWGLWATGVIAREHTGEVRRLGTGWDEEIIKYTFQDQVSEPVALREAGLRPTGFPGTHFSNPWLSYEGSGRH